MYGTSPKGVFSAVPSRKRKLLFRGTATIA